MRLFPVARQVICARNKLAYRNLALNPHFKINGRPNFRFQSTSEAVAEVETETAEDDTKSTKTFNVDKYQIKINTSGVGSKISELGKIVEDDQDISHLKEEVKPEIPENKEDATTGYFQNPYEEQIEEATMSASDEFVFELTKIYDHMQNKFTKAKSHEALANQVAEMRGVSPEMNRDDLQV